MHRLTQKLLVGLTGGIACGKTTVADYLHAHGAHLIDTDIIARQVVEPNTTTNKRIRGLLGDDYFLADGNLHRAKIKQQIFNNPVIKRQYEDIILPNIRQATLQAVKQTPDGVCYAVLIVPLLFEKGMYAYTDYDIVVDVPEDVQIQRAIARSPADAAVIRQIIAAQMPRQERHTLADFIIDNHGDLQHLTTQLEILHKHLCGMAKQGDYFHEHTDHSTH